MSDANTVVPARTIPGDKRTPEMVEAGTRFESYVRAAMTEQGLSLAQLARDTGVAASAWHGWFRGDRKPRRNSLVLVGRTLHRTPEELAAAWSGTRSPVRRPTETPDALVQALRDQTAAINALVALLAVEALPARVAALEAYVPVLERLVERDLEERPGLRLPAGTKG